MLNSTVALSVKSCLKNEIKKSPISYARLRAGYLPTFLLPLLSIINLSARYTPRYRIYIAPNAALFGIIFPLRFLTSLIKCHILFHSLFSSLSVHHRSSLLFRHKPANNPYALTKTFYPQACQALLQISQYPFSKPCKTRSGMANPPAPFLS